MTHRAGTVSGYKQYSIRTQSLMHETILNGKLYEVRYDDISIYFFVLSWNNYLPDWNQEVKDKISTVTKDLLTFNIFKRANAH